MADKKLAEYVIQFGKWSGLKLSDIPIDGIWWLLKGDFGMWKSTREALRGYLNWLWRNTHEAWLPYGEFMGERFDDCPTWWLQSQLTRTESQEAQHGCWPVPGGKQSNWSPCVKHLLRKEVLARETETGVMERYSNGDWYEKLPKWERENDFSPLSELKDAYPDLPLVEWHECNSALPHWVKPPLTEATGKWVRTMHFYTWGDQGWYEEWELQMRSIVSGVGRPSLWYGAKVKDTLTIDHDSEAARSKDSRKDWACVMQKPNSYVKAALQEALSSGMDCHWDLFKRRRARKEEIATWLETLQMLEIDNRKEETLLEQYLQACRWIANISCGDDLAAHDWLQILHTNYVRALQQEKEVLKCDQWHEAVEEGEDEESDDFVEKKGTKHRTKKVRAEEVKLDATVESFLDDLRRQKRTRKKLLKYKRKHEQRTEHAEEVLEEARNRLGGAWACKVVIGDTEGVPINVIGG